MLTQISNRRIGAIRFDAVTDESHISELSISENPIESGALIADHAVVKPKEITISGVMVEHDHATSPLEQLGVPYIRGVTDFLNSFPFPSKIATYTTQTIAKANRVLSRIDGLRSQVSGILNQARAIAPWLPDFGLGSNSIGDGRVQQCYADLVATQKSGETVEIQTGIHLYKDMLLTSIVVTQGLDGSARFDVTAREIFIVDTATVATVGKNKSGVSGKQKSGRAATQSAGKTQKGKVNISPRTPPSLNVGNSSKSDGSKSAGKRTSALANILG